MTVVAPNRTADQPVGRHRKPETPLSVPVIPGSGQPDNRLGDTSSEGFVIGDSANEYRPKPLSHPVDVASLSAEMEGLMHNINLSKPMREHVQTLLGKLSLDPRDRQTFYSLDSLRSNMLHTAYEADLREQHGPQPLAGRDRQVARQVLYELTVLGRGHDQDAIQTLQEALAVGQVAVETEAAQQEAGQHIAAS